MTSTRLLLVGAGVRGAMWARVISEAPDATLAGIVDRDESRARRARDDYASDALSSRLSLDEMGISYGRPGGGMYVYANISSSGLDAETFCLELLRQERVMVFPGTMFADPANRHIRITLLSPYSSMEVALRRMKRFVERTRRT